MLLKNPCGRLVTEFLISFEAWAKLAQQWLVCVPPLGIHLEPINNELYAVSDNMIINCAFWPKERSVQSQIRSYLGQWCAI